MTRKRTIKAITSKRGCHKNGGFERLLQAVNRRLKMEGDNPHGNHEDRLDELVKRNPTSTSKHFEILKAAYTPMENPADADRMRRAMGQLSLWLGRAVDEGRPALNSLRASTTEKNNLAEAFRGAIGDCRRQYSIEALFSVAGQPQELHPMLRDEIYRIGYEQSSMPARIRAAPVWR